MILNDKFSCLLLPSPSSTLPKIFQIFRFPTQNFITWVLIHVGCWYKSKKRFLLRFEKIKWNLHRVLIFLKWSQLLKFGRHLEDMICNVRHFTCLNAMTECFVYMTCVDNFWRSKTPSFVDGRRRKLTSTWCLLGYANKLTYLKCFFLTKVHYSFQFCKSPISVLWELYSQL